MTSHPDDHARAATPRAASTSHRMQFDVEGRVRNTQVAVQHAFLPIFEAVVNSIHATEERFGEHTGTSGRIEVHVQRVQQRSISETAGRASAEHVTSISITDNGVGFTDPNLRSFETADSRAKVAQGGKGVGRFTWLVVFERVRITSVHQAGAGLMRRSFTFRPSESGITDYVEEVCGGEIEPRTEVTLEGVRTRYANALRRTPEILAAQLFEHCFNYFVLKRCPEIVLIDETADGSQAIRVNDGCKELTVENPSPLRVGAHELQVRHVTRRYRAGSTHLAHLCANARVVTSFPLADVCDLGNVPIRHADREPMIHHAFVSGPALDLAADSTRTRLDLADGEPLLEEAGVLDLNRLKEALGVQLNDRYREHLREEREDNFRQIERHIRTSQPEYRYLLHRKKADLEHLRWSENRQQMDQDLYRIQQGLEADIRRQQADVEQKLAQEETPLEQVAEALYRFVRESNEAGQANLVRYVVKRRAVLNVLEQLISRFEGPAPEEHIHRIVFPVRRSGDQVAYEDHNLWLVDDTLAFYEHLTSDLAMSRNEGAPVESDRRPDILAVKTGDPYQHVALVEFKKPDRIDSNPVEQLVQYTQLLRRGGAIDIQGRTLPGIGKAVRIDGYAVATLTPAMEEALEVCPGNMTKIENEWRWLGGMPNLNLTIEFLDFRAFIRRAAQRNRAFFTRLGLT